MGKGKGNNSNASDEKNERQKKKSEADYKSAFLAVTANDLEALKKYMEVEAKSSPYLKLTDDNGDSLLSKACRLGFLNIVNFLVDNGATDLGLDKCYGDSYLFKTSESSNVMEIYLTLSYKNLLGSRRLKKINDGFYEIGY